jgi:hypothetical protein
MLQAKDIMFRYNSVTKLTYIRVGNVIIGTLQKFRGVDNSFRVSYSILNDSSFPVERELYFKTRREAIDHVVKELIKGNKNNQTLTVLDKEAEESFAQFLGGMK